MSKDTTNTDGGPTKGMDPYKLTHRLYPMVERCRGRTTIPIL